MRVDIDQTTARMDDIQNAIDDDPRQIFVYETEDSESMDYDAEPSIVKREISGTIYMANRNTSNAGKVKSSSGIGSGNRENYYLLTKDDLSRVIYIEMEGNRFEMVLMQNIRGDYKRCKLKSVENGKTIRGYT